MSIMESELTHFEQEKATALNDLMQLVWSDSTLGDLDSLQWYLNTYSGAEAPLDAAVKHQLSGSPAEAIGPLQDTQGQMEPAYLDPYYNLEASWYESVEQNKVLDPLPATMSLLNSMAISGAQGDLAAQAWLQVIGQEGALPDNVILPAGVKSMSGHRDRSGKKITNPFLQVHPNPSNGPVWAAYSVPDGVEEVELRCYDVQGRTVWSKVVSNKDGIVELNTQFWINGLYLVTAYFDGINTGSAKVEISK